MVNNQVLTMLQMIAPKFEQFFRRQNVSFREITRMRSNHRLGNMVAVMANDQQQFESLVTQLMSPDNNIRNQAEVGKFLLFLCDLFS